MEDNSLLTSENKIIIKYKTVKVRKQKYSEINLLVIIMAYAK